VAVVDLDDPRQVRDLQKRLVKAGVERRLEQAGARRGDEVVIGNVAFEFLPEADMDAGVSSGVDAVHGDGPDPAG